MRPLASFLRQYCGFGCWQVLTWIIVIQVHCLVELFFLPQMSLKCTCSTRLVTCNNRNLLSYPLRSQSRLGIAVTHQFGGFRIASKYTREGLFSSCTWAKKYSSEKSCYINFSYSSLVGRWLQCFCVTLVNIYLQKRIKTKQKSLTFCLIVLFHQSFCLWPFLFLCVELL